MIAFINGRLVDKEFDAVILDNQGIGYRVFCTNSMSFSLGETYLFYTHFQVREDAQILFGFIEKEELALFKTIISVKGIGPKTGMNIMSKGSANQLIQAIENEDLKYLKTLPGVGARTASQMILDLKGKVVTENVVNDHKHSNDQDNEVVLALMSLGFSRAELQSIQKTLNKEENQKTEHLIKIGLQLLNKKRRGQT